jgi:hypothetical protein
MVDCHVDKKQIDGSKAKSDKKSHIPLLLTIYLCSS